MQERLNVGDIIDLRLFGRVVEMDPLRNLLVVEVGDLDGTIRLCLHETWILGYLDTAEELILGPHSE